MCGTLTPRSYYLEPGGRIQMLVLGVIASVIAVAAGFGFMYTSEPICLIGIAGGIGWLGLVLNRPYCIDVKTDQTIEIQFLRQCKRIVPADIRAIKYNRSGMVIATSFGSVDIGPRTFIDSGMLLDELPSVNPNIEFLGF